METLQNEWLTVEVSTLGAELQSIRDRKGKEYLWQGDAKYWPRRSPILFPIVCGLWEETYRVEGKEYHLPRHGFAREMEFEIVSQSETEITLLLESNDETLEKYPFEFSLAISYCLVGSELNVVWQVFNKDNKEIHFSIGGHPAFYVPGIKEGEALKGTLQFDTEDPLERIIGNTNGCIKPERYPVETKNGKWEFTEESFKDDAVIMDKCQIHEAALLNEDGTPAVTVTFDAPAVGFWTPYGKHAPFLCIEPWYGVHDYAGFTGELKDKYLINHLQPGASFLSEYSIVIG